MKANVLMLTLGKVVTEASLWASPRPRIRPLAAPCPADEGSISGSAHEADAPGAALATHGSDIRLMCTWPPLISHSEQLFSRGAAKPPHLDSC